MARGTLPSSAPWPVPPIPEGRAVLRLWSLLCGQQPAPTPRACREALVLLGPQDTGDKTGTTVRLSGAAFALQPRRSSTT